MCSNLESRSAERRRAAIELQDLQAQQASALEMERAAAARDKEHCMRELANRCGAAAEAEEEVDLVLTLAPITVLRPRAGEA